MNFFQHNDGILSNVPLLVKSNDLLELICMKKNFIKEIRKDRDLTIQGLADLVKTSNQQISNLENGKRRLTWEWIQKLAEALECHPSDITNGPGTIMSADNDKEKELLDLYRGLSDDAQSMFLHTLQSFPTDKKNKD